MTTTQATIDTIEVQQLPDFDADTSYLEQEDFAERFEEYQNGAFGFVGIRASATIKIPSGSGYILQTITSPGLWGIEDDSDATYLKDVAREEFATLKNMLESLNVDVSEFDELAELAL